MTGTPARGQVGDQSGLLFPGGGSCELIPTGASVPGCGPLRICLKFGHELRGCLTRTAHTDVRVGCTSGNYMAVMSRVLSTIKSTPRLHRVPGCTCGVVNVRAACPLGR